MFIIHNKDRKELLEWLAIKLPSDTRRFIATTLFLAENNTRRSTIAAIVGYSEDWVYAIIHSYRIGGIEAVRPKPMGRPPKRKRNDSFEQGRFDW